MNRRITSDRYDNNWDNLNAAKAMLIANNGQYYKLNVSGWDCPLEMLKHAQENGWTLQSTGGLLEKHERGFADFHGNFNEYSAAFHYRIYDPALVEAVEKGIAATMDDKRLRRATQYAAKFLTENLDSGTHNDLSDDNLRRAFAGCVSPLAEEFYDDCRVMIRRELAARNLLPAPQDDKSEGLSPGM